MTLWTRRLLFGHRGAPATGLPENSLASFARALQDGANALETDVHRTADGAVVVSHDPSVGGVIIREHTLAQVQQQDLGGGERVPLLVDMLARFPGVPVNVDIKQRGIAAAVVDAVRDAGQAERVLLTSFHVEELERVRALGYPGPTGLASREVARLLMTPSPLLRVWRLRGVRAQVPAQSGRWRLDTRAFVDKAHALGIAVDYWTINDADEGRRLLALGADGLMSDGPGALASLFP